MRTLVDLPEKDIRALDASTRIEGVSRAEIGRRRLALSAAAARGMASALFDTNILIDYLVGRPAAQRELSRYRVRKIGVNSWMEVMVGSHAPGVRFPYRV